MKISILGKCMLYCASILIMSAAVWQLNETSVYADACPSSCCKFGVDCLSSCCLPRANEADCSGECKNYCREDCLGEIQ